MISYYYQADHVWDFPVNSYNQHKGPEYYKWTLNSFKPLSFKSSFNLFDFDGKNMHMPSGKTEIQYKKLSFMVHIINVDGHIIDERW